MNSALSVVVFLLSGGLAGAIYLGLIWASVRAAARGGGLSPIAIGAVARLILVAIVGYVVVAVGAGGFDMLAGLAGFMVARFVGVAIARSGLPARKENA